MKRRGARGLVDNFRKLPKWAQWAFGIFGALLVIGLLVPAEKKPRGQEQAVRTDTEQPKRNAPTADAVRRARRDRDRVRAAEKRRRDGRAQLRRERSKRAAAAKRQKDRSKAAAEKGGPNFTPGAERSAYDDSKAICGASPAGIRREYGGQPDDPTSTARAYSEQAYIGRFRQAGFEGCLAGLR